MELTSRESWAVIHGLVLGALFLLAFAGALAGLWSFRPGLITAKGIQERVLRLKVGFGAMAVIAWGTVITGTWIVYPWYRAKLDQCAGLELPSAACSPRNFLLANVNGQTADWHHFGMEWKEHIAWASPLLATSAFLLVLYYGPRIIARPWLRTAIIVLLVGAFGAAAIAGVFGAFINKVAPIS
ncbi:MAG: hypothetical protein HHJ11_17480 [Phycicoccus sp.]|nr:hypothetical protein [Phycicoccus sp.]NMM35339.1 hypothetical protein [Phycicoccus sp.]